ncbi:MAG: ADP-ribosylglycohydrolase family protein [Ilumatobacteraceae bacterium]
MDQYSSTMWPTLRRKHPLSQPTKHRAIGALAGAAVGDALGAPFEFMPRGTFTMMFPAPVLGGTGEMAGGGSFGWAPGEFTDDSQMGVALAESLLDIGGYDPDAVWARWRAWATTARDIGITTARSLAHADWREVSPAARGAGNGALMRAFPLALAFLDARDDDLRDVVLHQAALTHTDPAAGWGAWIAVEMMRFAIVGDDPFVELPSLIDDLPDAVRRAYAEILSPEWTPGHEGPSNGSVWGCLAQAVWAVRNTTTFEDAVVAAVSLGDDTDTVACVAGAIAGAMYGVQAIPSRWATYVHGSVQSADGLVHYRWADLHGLALRLIGLTGRPDTEPEEVAGPAEVAPSLFAADLLGATTAPTDWAVVSLCRTGDRFGGHAVRRQVFLIDDDGDHNSALDVAVRDAVDSVDAFLAEGRTVVVHCHGGRSRTGLVLKAWKMRRDGIDERAAHHWLAGRWHRYADYNDSFVEHLRTEW